MKAMNERELRMSCKTFEYAVLIVTYLMTILCVHHCVCVCVCVCVYVCVGVVGEEICARSNIPKSPFRLRSYKPQQQAANSAVYSLFICIWQKFDMFKCYWQKENRKNQLSASKFERA
ncbi:hypothetical protein PAMP_021130 [Pampus punctatissimus]